MSITLTGKFIVTGSSEYIPFVVATFIEESKLNVVVLTQTNRIIAGVYFGILLDVVADDLTGIHECIVDFQTLFNHKGVEMKVTGFSL